MRLLYATTANLDRHEAPACHVLNFCHALSKLGHEVTLLHPSGRNLILPELHGVVSRVSVPYVPVRGWWRIFPLLFNGALTRLDRTRKFDAVYLRISITCRLARGLSRIASPLFFEVNGPAQLSDPNVGKVIRLFELIFADSEEIIRRAATQWDLSRDRFVLNPNCGINPGVFRRAVNSRRDRKHGALSRTFLIGHASSFLPHNDFDTIIQAVRYLQPPVEVVFCGSGPRLTEVKRKCAQNRIQAHFTGALAQDQLIRVLFSADVCVNALTEWSQRSGNLRSFKVHEYLAMGVPTVDTIDPALPIPDWAQSYLGLVPFGDPGAMARLLQQIRDNQSLWEGKAEQARRWVTSNRTWMQVVGRAAQAIESRLEDRESAPNNIHAPRFENPLQAACEK